MGWYVGVAGNVASPRNEQGGDGAMSVHGYSRTPLIRKLGLKAGMRVRLLNPPPRYWDRLGGSAASLEVQRVTPLGRERADFTHLFATTPAALERYFSLARRRMAERGVVWASWPKQRAGTLSAIARDDVMRIGKRVGLVDVKVCAVDEIWSALKFVIPLAKRSSVDR